MKTAGAFLFLAALCFLAAFPWAGGAAESVGASIIFVAGEGADRSLMMVDPAGGQPAALADLPGADTQPAVGPRGQVAWINHDGTSWNLVEGGRVTAAGGGDMHLSPAYAPDGTLAAAVSGEAETSLYAFRGGDRIQLVPGGDGLAVSPAFSPDGLRLAYVSNKSGLARVYLLSIREGVETALTSDAERATDPAWSPDGQWLAFVLAETDICLIRPDGRDFRRLTRDQGENAHPSFSPDGRKIIFSSTRDGMRRLFVMNADGGEQHPLLPGLAVPQHLPVWSPVAPKPVAAAE